MSTNSKFPAIKSSSQLETPPFQDALFLEV